MQSTPSTAGLSHNAAINVIASNDSLVCGPSISDPLLINSGLATPGISDVIRPMFGGPSIFTATTEDEARISKKEPVKKKNSFKTLNVPLETHRK